ncbi:von Willebrand factor, type A [actinobacterium SCGC AAA044-D11]
MKVNANLDLDLVALETQDRITLMLDLTAPISEADNLRPGQAVQVVLDRSGSMRGAPLKSALESIQKMVDRLAPQDSFGLVAFDDQSLVIAPHRKMSEHHLPSLRQVIHQIHPGGSTDISSGYLMGLREITQAKNNSGSTLLLISDGHANAGEKDPKKLEDIASQAATNTITTSTIGLGNGYDEKILAALATGGGGQHRFAATIDEAIGAIASEVDDLLDKSAINVILKVAPVPGLTGAPAIELLQQLPHWMEGDTIVVQLGDFYAGENRRFMIDFAVPGMAALGLTTIAQVTLEYLNLSDMKDFSVEMPIQVNVVPDDIAKGRTANPIVRAERMVLSAQSEKALANEELLQGNVKDAATRLKNSASNLLREAANITASDERSLESLQIIRTEADEMERLATYAEQEEAEFSIKRNMESFSRNSRARKLRPDPNAKLENGEDK